MRTVSCKLDHEEGNKATYFMYTLALFISCEFDRMVSSHLHLEDSHSLGSYTQFVQ